MKQRTLRRIRRDRPVDYFYSFKNNCHAWVESTLELDFLYWLEFDDRVAAYTTQPESADTPVGRYTPDVLVEFRDGSSTYFDPHPYKYVHSKTFQNKFAKKARYIERLTGRPVRVVTEKELNPISIANLKTLYPYLRNEPTELETSLLVGHSHPATFGDLIGLAESMGVNPYVPFALLAHSHIGFDNTVELSNITKLRS